MQNPTREIQTVAHNVRLRRLTVMKVEEITAKIRRITLTGEDLADFVSLSPDDHVKVFFPLPGEDEPIVPLLGPDGLKLPDGAPKPIMRDYTPRRFDRKAKELELEFFIHGEGAASQWAAQARPGHRLTVGGPRGSKIVPYEFDWYLLIGDESAVPSFSRRLLELPAGSRALVFIETENASEKLELQSRGSAEIHWLFRNGKEPGHAEAIKAALLNHGFPEGDFFAWVALEKTCAMEVRDFLLAVKGARHEWLKATGYWTRK